jgi:hypothetical protein
LRDTQDIRERVLADVFENPLRFTRLSRISSHSRHRPLRCHVIVAR